MAFTAGVANVLVVPSFRGFQSAVGRQVNSTMPAAGRTAGAAMGGGVAAVSTKGSFSVCLYGILTHHTNTSLKTKQPQSPPINARK